LATDREVLDRAKRAVIGIRHLQERIMVLHLPDDLARDLSAAADKQCITPEQLAIGYLRQHIPAMRATESESAGGTMADYLRDVIGVINSAEMVPGGANMSQDTGKKFTEIVLKKRTEGKL